MFEEYEHEQTMSLKRQDKGAGIGDREPIIVNISHESKMKELRG